MDIVLLALAKSFFGQVHIVCNFLGLNDLDAVIRIEKENDHFGFLLDIVDTELLEPNHSENIEAVTAKIVEFMTDVYRFSKYNYAFCDHEAEIQYTPEKFKEIQTDKYSIVVAPSTDGQGRTLLNVMKSNWNIDGLTVR